MDKLALIALISYTIDSQGHETWTNKVTRQCQQGRETMPTIKVITQPPLKDVTCPRVE